MLLTPPPPVTNCHTFSNPLPLERDVLYGRPLGFKQVRATIYNASLAIAMLIDAFKLHYLATYHNIIMGQQ